MRWIIAILIVVFAFIGIAYVVGTRLPARHTAIATALIQAPQGEVYARIANVTNLPTWRPSVKAVTALPSQDNHDCWREGTGNDALDLCLLRADPFSTRVVSVSGGTSFSGTWTYTLTPASLRSTTVAITEDATVPSPFFRAAMLAYGADTTAKIYLKDLQTSFPAGH